MFDIPPNQTTMIGSLPQATAEEALEALKVFPLSVPAWPQVPRRSFKEGMLAQYSQGLPGVRVDEEEKRIWVEKDDDLLNAMSRFYEEVLAGVVDPFAITAEYAEGLDAFLDQLKSLPGKIPLAKGQVVGPFSLGLGVNDNQGRAVWFDEQYRDVIIKGLTKKALWQIEKLKQYAENIIIFFDEPILSALGTPAYMGISDEDVIQVLDEAAEEVRNAGAAVGVHCCGNMDWGLLARTSIDIISFDAFSYGEKLALYPEAISGFLERGGYLAWGIVPTSGSDVVSQAALETLSERMKELITLFENKGIPSALIQERKLLTPACGMGNLSLEEAEKVLELLQKLGKSGF
ncbi:methionine synthase [Fibrobacterota bacterium]